MRWSETRKSLRCAPVRTALRQPSTKVFARRRVAATRAGLRLAVGIPLSPERFSRIAAVFGPTAFATASRSLRHGGETRPTGGLETMFTFFLPVALICERAPVKAVLERQIS